MRQQWHNRQILRADFELLHDGMQRLGRKVFSWTVIEDGQPASTATVLRLDELGLERLQTNPQPWPCTTCMHRQAARAPECVMCRLTQNHDGSYIASHHLEDAEATERTPDL